MSTAKSIENHINTALFTANSSYLYISNESTNKDPLVLLVQNYTLPGITVSQVEVPGNNGRKVKIPDDIIVVDDATISFALSESLTNYRKIKTWMIESTVDKAMALRHGFIIFTDNDNRPSISATLNYIFPTTLSPITIDHTLPDSIGLQFSVGLSVNEFVFDGSEI